MLQGQELSDSRTIIQNPESAAFGPERLMASPIAGARAKVWVDFRHSSESSDKTPIRRNLWIVVHLSKRQA
jgi:hypothetical protein